MYDFMGFWSSPFFCEPSLVVYSHTNVMYSGQREEKGNSWCLTDILCAPSKFCIFLVQCRTNIWYAGPALHKHTYYTCVCSSHTIIACLLAQDVYFVLKYIYHHLKLEIALAIPASNDWKIKTNKFSSSIHQIFQFVRCPFFIIKSC